jgi:hypothetical protein
VFIERRPAEKSGLELAIDEVLREMQGFTAESDEYAKMTTQLERLYKLKEIDCPQRVSHDTIVIVIGNIIGIAMIIGYERTNIITSKALTLLIKMR